MERIMQVALLAFVAGVGALGLQLALWATNGFWTPFTVMGIWYDVTGKPPPFAGLSAALLDHPIALQLVVGGLLVLVGAVLAEEFFLSKQRRRRARKRRSSQFG